MPRLVRESGGKPYSKSTLKAQTPLLKQYFQSKQAYPGVLLAMRVGKTTMSAARFYLRDQGEIDSLLARLVTFRKDRPRR